VHPTTGDVYFGNHPKIQKLSRSTGKWVTIAGGGATPYYSGDTLTGSNISFNGWAPMVLGFDGSGSLMGVACTNLITCALKTYNITSTVQSALAGDGTLMGALSADGTLGSATKVPQDYNWIPATWDAAGSRWAMVETTNSTKLRTLSAGGTLGTETTTSEGMQAFAYRHNLNGTNNIVYYCNGNTGKIRKKDITGGTTTDLAWPIATLACSGRGMMYSTSRNSLFFTFTQNGLGGVAEYFNP
jgi:hypothetical protein